MILLGKTFYPLIPNCKMFILNDNYYLWKNIDTKFQFPWWKGVTNGIQEIFNFTSNVNCEFLISKLYCTAYNDKINVIYNSSMWVLLNGS